MPLDLIVKSLDMTGTPMGDVKDISTNLEEFCIQCILASSVGQSSRPSETGLVFPQHDQAALVLFHSNRLPFL